MRKIYLITMLVIMFFVGIGVNLAQTAAPVFNIIDEDSNPNWLQDIKVDYNYGFTMTSSGTVKRSSGKTTSCSTEVENPGSATGTDRYILGSEAELCFRVSSDNDIAVIYESVGVTNDGTVVDLKIELENYIIPEEKHSKTEYSYIGFTKDRIDVTVTNLNHIELKLTLLEHGTDTAIKTDGFISLVDVDSSQYMSLASNDGEIDAWYVVETSENEDGTDGGGDDRHEHDEASWAQYPYETGFDPETCATINSGERVNAIATNYYYLDSNNVYTIIGRQHGFDPRDSNTDFNNYAMATFSDSSSFTLTFGGCVTSGFWASGFYISESLLKVEIPKPVKAVSSEKVEIGEEFTFTITQYIPYQNETNYYSSYVLTDTLESYLQVPDASDIKVTDISGADVTEWFDITVSGQTITAVATNTDSSEFYGNTYTFSFNTKVIDSIPDSVFDDEGNYTIPNHATSIITYKDGGGTEEQETNEVKVTVSKKSTLIVNVPSTFASSLKLIGIGVILIIIAGMTIYVITRKRKKDHK